LRRAGLVRGALRPRPILEVAATNFPDIIAEYEAELVHRACQAEGFNTALTEKVLARHARHPALLDYAERRSDGVGHYIRCLGELISRPAE
jgi:hypothetical protein